MNNNLNDKVNEILNKEIDPIYFEVAKKIEPRLTGNKFLPWLIAHKTSVEGAKILMALPDEDWTTEMGKFKASDAFVKRVGMEKELIEEQFEKMFYSGDMVWFEDGAKITPSITMWHDLQNSRKVFKKNGPAYYKALDYFYDNEMIQIWEPDAEERIREGKLGCARIIPRYDSVKDHPDLLPAENIKEILKTREFVSLNHCACRDRHPDSGDINNEDERVCISFNETAKLLDDMYIGDLVPWEEAFERVQKLGKKYPHVHINKHTDSIDEIGEVMCSCSVKSCLIMRKPMELGSKYPVWEYYGKSRFRAVIDPEKCINCGLCAEKRCMFDAIKMKYNKEVGEEKHWINETLCMGCGCCVETCPKDAITMKVVSPPELLKGYKLKEEKTK